METQTKSKFTFGEGKQKVVIESVSLLAATKQYIRLVESKGNESDWDFNKAYKEAVKFVNKNELKAESIDLTPTWQTALNIYLAVIENTKSEQGRADAVKGLKQMADVAQAYADLVKTGEDSRFISKELLREYIKK